MSKVIVVPRHEPGAWAASVTVPPPPVYVSDFLSALCPLNSPAALPLPQSWRIVIRDLTQGN